jgi:hypothetical protein
VRLPDGRLKRIDFAFVDVKLGIEADSYRHHSSLTTPFYNLLSV